MTGKKPDLYVTVTNEALLLAISAGMVKLNEQLPIPEPNWYPCGFAWACIKIRKNHRLANVLKAHDWRWDDYRKHYYFSISAEMVKADGMWQSMNYRSRCLNAFAAELQLGGFRAMWKPEWINRIL